MFMQAYPGWPSGRAGHVRVIAQKEQMQEDKPRVSVFVCFKLGQLVVQPLPLYISHASKGLLKEFQMSSGRQFA
jgi:hypothetical protein